MIGSFLMSDVASRLQAQWSGSAAAVCTGVSTDSRSLRAGDLFVALRGERHDGHAHLAQARANGAVAAVVDTPVDDALPQLPVFDTRRALADLGAMNRDRFAGVLAALTGSAGKTTTKNMLAAIFAQAGSTLATPGNLNNEIGVPLTLLSLEAQHRFAVVEMGAAKRGDIAYLMQFVRPQAALITNALPAHLAGFGSVDGVAQGKGEIYQCLPDTATAVLNVDESWAPLWHGMIGRRSLLRFGWRSDAAADIRAVDVRLDERGQACFVLQLPSGAYPVNLPVPGLQQVSNALAAAALATALGVDPDSIVAGLATFRGEPGRLSPRHARCGAYLLDDTYNANPGSVHQAIELLSVLPSRRVLILGEMAELGEASAALHAEVAASARQHGIEQLWLLGPHASEMAVVFGAGAQVFADMEALIAHAGAQLQASDSVLVKGSRCVRMERVVQALIDDTGRGEH